VGVVKAIYPFEELFQRLIELILILFIAVAAVSAVVLVTLQVKAETASRTLVVMKRTGDAPSLAATVWSPAFHTGRYRAAYQDLSTQPWEIYLRYHGCPETRQGALRLTLYRILRGTTTLSPDEAFR
jgi:hypothetical protein